MRTTQEIVAIANKKLQAADFLAQNNYCDDAYYLGGYAFELCLKAKICKTLLIEDFFDFENSKNRKLPIGKTKRLEKDNLYKPFKVHDYEQLLILSGMFKSFDARLAIDPQFTSDWSIASKWDESLRYGSGSNCTDVLSFLESIKNLVLWLKQYL